MKTLFGLLLTLFLFESDTSHAETEEVALFARSFFRTLGGLDVERFLSTKFDLSQEKVQNGSYRNQGICGNYNFSTHSYLGTVLPDKQESLVQKPEQAFVSWYKDCVAKYILAKWRDFEELDEVKDENEKTYNDEMNQINQKIYASGWQNNEYLKERYFLIEKRNREIRKILTPFIYYVGEEIFNHLFREIGPEYTVDFTESLKELLTEIEPLTEPLMEPKDKSVQTKSIRDLSYMSVHVVGNYEWSKVPENIKLNIIQNLIHRYLGPEFILEEKGIIGDHSFILGSPKNAMELAKIFLQQPISLNYQNDENNYIRKYYIQEEREDGSTVEREETIDTITVEVAIAFYTHLIFTGIPEILEN